MAACPNCGRETPPDAAFCPSCGFALLAAEPGHEERKLISVLFVDLVGSTARAEQLDPEDVRALLRRYHDTLRRALAGYGGTVEKFIGDAVVAVYGAPIAHEDDPERAVRAALAARDAIADLNTTDFRTDGLNYADAAVALNHCQIIHAARAGRRGEHRLLRRPARGLRLTQHSRRVGIAKIGRLRSHQHLPAADRAQDDFLKGSPSFAVASRNPGAEPPPRDYRRRLLPCPLRGRLQCRSTRRRGDATLQKLPSRHTLFLFHDSPPRRQVCKRAL